MNARVLYRLTLMNVMLTLEYRGAFLIYMFNSVVVPLIPLVIWLTVSVQGVPLPYARSQFVTYYVMLGVVSVLAGVWVADYLPSEIRLGLLSPWLLRPSPRLLHYVGNNLGEKIIKLPLLLPMVVLAALAFHADLRLPTAFSTWLLFGGAVALAATLTFLLDVVISSFAFWVQDVEGIIGLKVALAGFLAGRFIPLALFPPAFAGFLAVQPFRYTLSFPLEILTGSLSAAATARGFAWAVAYCVVLYAGYRLLWRYGLRAYAATGA
ncbi:MAG TPA: ABC-2 family transporter protein [Chloroflexota bacterium]|nr:ABC-2 family transporter protein [Chloroflexota bacterium]